MTPQEALAGLIVLVDSYAGCSARTEPDRLGGICAPNGPPFAESFFEHKSDALDTNSCCEVFGSGCISVAFKQAGIALLQEPLDGSGAVGQWARTHSAAKKSDAVRSPADTGSGLRVGCLLRLETQTARHWEFIVEDLGGGRYRVVAGGALDQGFQSVSSAVHDIRGLFDHTSNKPVVEWIDCQTWFEALLGDPADGCVGEEPTSL